MKKFVGKVNGKSYDNEQDFKKAVREAVKNNENLNISSYYEEQTDTESAEDAPDEKSVEEPCLGVSFNAYAIPDGVTSKTFCGDYKFPDGLTETLENANNKEEIEEECKKVIDDLDSKIKTSSSKISTTEVEINKLQKELATEYDNIKDLKARRRYYNSIVDIVTSSGVETVKRPEIGGFWDDNIFSFLNRIGFRF